MAQIQYRAAHDKNRVTAATAKDAVRLFLEQFKNRRFSVMELRDGVFTFTVGRPGPSDCFYRSFTSRDAARAWVAS